MLKVLVTKWKEYLHIPFQWLSIISTILWGIFSIFFWKTLSSISGFSFETFIRFLFYIYFIRIIWFIFWDITSVVYEIRAGNFSFYMTYPTDPIIYSAFRNHYPTFGEIILTSIYLFLIKFKISLEEILLLVYSAMFMSIFTLFLAFLSANFESDFGDRLLNLILYIGEYPTFIFKGKLNFIVNFVLPTVFVGTFPLLIKYNLSLLRMLFNFSLILLPILFASSYILFKRFLRNYQAYGG